MLHLLFKRVGLSGMTIAAVLLLAPSTRASTPTDLTVKVTAASFKVGTQGRYTVTVANRGNQPTDDEVHVRVTLPAGLTFVSRRGSAWTCSAAGQSVDCVTQRSFGVGRTSTVSLKVAVCSAAFPWAVTSFQVVYAADTNTGNNLATKTTAVRPGQCGSGSTTPPANPGTPTPAPPGAPTRTPAPGNGAAPVVTSVTCNGGAQCEVSVGESFMLRFNFTDADGNAVSWHITARRDDGVTSEAGRGNLGTPTGSATIPLQFPGFTCPQGPCRQSVFEFAVTATDTTGLTSAPASVAITVRGTGG